MKLRNIFLIISLLVFNACSQAGWVGYYQMKKPAVYVNSDKSDFNIFLYPNTADILNKKNLGLSLPKECSSFRLAGFFTPFTPPIPLPNFRSWHSGEKDDCGYFAIYSNSSGIKITLKTKNQVYQPKVYGYTKYIFPIRAKDIDSGVIIIEKDGEKIEVPFEYKYFRFWY